MAMGEGGSRSRSRSRSRGRGAREEFRNYVRHAHLRNKHSAKDTQVMSSKATSAGAKGVEDFAAAGKGGKHPKNFQRDLKRTMLKGSKAPTLYWAEVPGWVGNKKVLICLPFLLVHEVLAMLVACGNNLRDMAQLPSQVPGLKHMMNTWCTKQRTPPEATIGIGLHGDGVPTQKSGKSIDVFSWNLLSAPSGDRFPFTMVEKQFMCQCGCGGRCNEFSD